MEERTYPLKEVRVYLEQGRTLYSKDRLDNAMSAAAIMQREMSRYDREVVCIVNMNTALQPINFNVVSMGTLSCSLVDIPNVLKASILSNAASFMVFHNHPSGNTAPSEEDLEITKRLILAGHLIGIPCIDHVIIAGNGKEIHSMRENEDVNFAPGYDRVMEEAASMAAEPETLGTDTYETPFGNIDPGEIERAMYHDYGTPPEERAMGQTEQITLHFGKGLCQFFTSKKGAELARIKIPNSPFESWPSFVVPAKIVRENRFGKGYWMKLPKDGKTSMSVSKRITNEDGSQEWENKRLSVDNVRLKSMVEAYRKEPQEKDLPMEDLPEGRAEKSR